MIAAALACALVTTTPPPPFVIGPAASPEGSSDPVLRSVPQTDAGEMLNDDADAVLADPASYHPIVYIVAVRQLWDRGDRAQAAFWYYMWQARTRPWARADSQVAQARGALDSVFGPLINQWVQSDREQFFDLVERVLAYEARLPLSNERPVGIALAQWNEIVAQERDRYANGFESAIRQLWPSADAHAQLRAQAGLEVGPWQNPGAPLRDEWR